MPDKKKKTSISQPVEIHYGFISFFISLPLSQPGSAAHGCTHTHTHTLSYTPPPSTHTHTLIPFLSPTVSLFLPLSLCLCSSLPFFYILFFFMLFAFAVCFALQPPPFSLSIVRSFAHSLPLHSFSPSLHFPPPPLFSVCAE